MNTINLSELIDRCHAGSRNKGFWDVRPDPRQQLMLAISELSEALEADRKDKYAKLGSFKIEEDAGFMNNGDFATTFCAYVKDSPGDELADTYIRLCDYAGGYEVDVLEWEACRQSWLADHHVDTVPENFGAALLPIVQDILNINTARKIESALALSAALGKLELLCSAKDIDLATHIDLKLRYNATRPAKHGKAY